MPHLINLKPWKQGLIFPCDEELFNAFLYLFGAVIFVIGSVPFLPVYKPDYMAEGCWLFVLGSIIYFVVATHDSLRLCFSEDFAEASILDIIAAGTCLIASLLFAVGSAWFLPSVDKVVPAAWLFVIGSFLFLIASFVNALKIFEAPTIWNARYLLITDCCFISGSVMFMVASVPYIYNYETKDDRHMIYRYLAQQFIVGSALFVGGGVVDLARTLLMDEDEKTDARKGQTIAKMDPGQHRTYDTVPRDETIPAKMATEY